MTTTVRRTGDEANTWTQTTAGETPNSVSISTNAKGHAQVEVKLYYASAEAMAAQVDANLTAILRAVRAGLAEHGIPLAGHNSAD